MGWYQVSLPLPLRCGRRKLIRQGNIANAVADRAHNYAINALRERDEYHRAVTDRADAQASDAIPTPNNRLAWVLREIRGESALQQQLGIEAQQERFVRVCIRITEQLDRQQQPHGTAGEERTEQEGWKTEQQEVEDQQLVLMDEGRRAEQQQEQVETEQAEESPATSPLRPPPPPLPSPHATEAELQEVEEPQATPPPQSPTPPSLPHAAEEDKETRESSGGRRTWKSRPPPSSLPPQPEIPVPVDDAASAEVKQSIF